MGEEKCGSHNPTRFLLIYNFLMTCSLPLLGRTGKERDRRRGEKSFCSFCTSCLLSCLLLAFGLFSVSPAIKSLKQFTRYALVKILKTNYKLKSRKRGQKPAMKKEEKERRKTKEEEREKVGKRAVLNEGKGLSKRHKEGYKIVKKREANNQKKVAQKGES